MTEYPDTSAVLEGHTDSKGSDAYIQKLSQRRADAVVKCLIDNFRISADRLKASVMAKPVPWPPTTRTKAGPRTAGPWP